MTTTQKRITVNYLFLGNGHYLNFLSCVLIFFCTEGIGLGSSKGNVITFRYTPEIHDFLVKIKWVT